VADQLSSISFENPAQIITRTDKYFERKLLSIRSQVAKACQNIKTDMEVPSNSRIDTIIQHFGEETKDRGAVVPPIFQNSLFVYDTVEQFRAKSKSTIPGDHLYSRISNPSLEVVEKKLAVLEGTERCKLVGSGMSAITAVILSCVKQGSHIVCVDTAYGPARELIAGYLPRFGVTHTFVDGACEEDIFDAVTPETSLVYLESPSSLVFRLQNLEAIGKFCKEQKIKSAIDNTYATPLLQNPAKYGIDFVIHSCSKYIGGHSDVIAGAICCTEQNLKTIISQEVALITSALAPFNAWLLNRGLRTLRVRLQRHETSANEVAAWLFAQSWVRQVNHLGLSTYPQRELFKRQMSGSGGLFSFIPADQDQAKIDSFLNALKIFGIGVSWGGFESLVVTTPITASHLVEATNFVRLFIGLEDVSDIIADLDQAGKIAFS